MSDARPLPPRVIFVNRFYYPDHSATAQMLTDIAEGLALAGQEVAVLTSRMGYEDPAARFLPRERVNGVEIHRVATTRFGRSFLPGRLVDYLSFYVTSLGALAGLARRGDIVVIKTDPPLLSALLGPAARLKGAKVVNWLQDIFPETAAELGVRVARSPLGTLLRTLRNRSVRAADMNVAIGPAMARRLKLMGARDTRLTILENFCDDAAIRPVGRKDNLLRAEWGFTADDFIVGYSGNLGRAHDVETFLGAAEQLRDRPDIHFLFIGGGHLRAQLETEAQRRGLSSIRTRPYQAREALAQSLSVADVHWASLQPSLEGLILPSKLYGIAAAGRPLIMVGDPEGDIGRWVRQHKFGYAVPPGAPEAFAAAVLALKSDTRRLQTMGDNARAFLEDGRQRDQILTGWVRLVDRLGRSNPRSGR